MTDKPNYNVFDIVLAVCKEQDGLCMDVPAERYRLARAITFALHEAGVAVQGTVAPVTAASGYVTS